MALTPERIRELERNHVYNQTATLIDFARAIEAEVRKDYEALIRRMLEKLELFDDAGPLGEGWQSNELEELLADARARLENAP